jgi:hypothetical protein
MFAASCREHVADTPAGNKQPRTFLWLYPDSTVGVGVSRQHLHWWGEDPDGEVKGYLFAFAVVNGTVRSLPSPDTLRYTWVTANDTTLLFPMDTVFKRFLVAVRSVDNTFRALASGSIVRFASTPFRDVNDNGIYDAGDVLLPDLPGAVDPAGAVETFPIRNTPPSVAFAQNPNDPTIPLKQPASTYTVATFGWNGSDPDGNNTLVSYRIALNDTSSPSNWLTVPLIDTVVTLVVPRSRSDAAGGTVTADVYGGAFVGRQYRGQLPGLRLEANNTFFVEAKDVAGEYSVAATMPSGADRWFVRRPGGKLLLVTDYVNADAASALGAYRAALASIPGGAFSSVDQLDISAGLTASDKLSGKYGANLPPFIDPALIHTFLLYDYVVWYTDQYPTLGAAQLSLFTYIQNGGKVLFSTSFQNTIDPRGALRDFAPIDSVSSVDLSPTRPRVPPAVLGDTRIPANFIVIPDSTNPASIYPQIAFNAAPVNHSIFMRPIYRRSDAHYLYHLQADTRNPQRYLGSPSVAVVDGQRTIIFFGLPLHLLNNTNSDPISGETLGAGLAALFTKMFTQQFNPMQRVNRTVF